MEKRKYYQRARFPAATIQEAHDLFVLKANPSKRGEPNCLRVGTEDEVWEFDTLEEFLAEYPNSRDFRLDDILGKHQEFRFIVEESNGRHFGSRRV